MASLLLPEGQLNRPVHGGQDQGQSCTATLNRRGTSVIGRSAVLTAQVMADSIVIAGEVNGDVAADTYVRLLPSARIRGNVTAPVLVIHEGAVVEGHCSARSIQPGAREAVRFYETAREEI